MLIYEDEKYEIFQTKDGELVIIEKDKERLDVFEKEARKVA